MLRRSTKTVVSIIFDAGKRRRLAITRILDTANNAQKGTDG